MKIVVFCRSMRNENGLVVYTPPPPPPIFGKYTAHLLRRTLKINAQRIKDTPALYFQLTPCICTVYFPKVFFAISGASASSISKRHFRTDTDVRGYTEKRVFA